MSLGSQNHFAYSRFSTYSPESSRRSILKKEGELIAQGMDQMSQKWWQLVDGTISVVDWRSISDTCGQWG